MQGYLADFETKSIPQEFRLKWNPRGGFSLDGGFWQLNPKQKHSTPYPNTHWVSFAVYYWKGSVG